MSTLEKAIAIAVKAHSGQQDRYGAPYILHPLRVMFKVNTETEQTVAVLHDVIEKSAVTFDDLAREGFAGNMIDAIDSLSKREGESYFDYIKRAKKNPLAARIKKADLEDKLDLIKENIGGKKDPQRFKRYLEAHALLMDNKAV